jgi:excisionase family DNA binding protein
MNKKETAERLNCSTRQVEKYASEGRLGEVTYVRGKTGKQADYSEEAVDKLKSELEAPDHQLVATQSTAAVLIAPQDRERFIAALEAIAASSEQTRTGLIVASRPGVPIENKLSLTLAEAAQYSGYSKAVLSKAIHAGKLKAKKGLARGWNIKADDLKAWVKRL